MVLWFLTGELKAIIVSIILWNNSISKVIQMSIQLNIIIIKTNLLEYIG